MLVYGDIEATRQALVNGGLPQRSRATRATIVKIVQLRLTRWNPPAWVLDDLIAFAQDGHHDRISSGNAFAYYAAGSPPL